MEMIGAVRTQFHSSMMKHGGDNDPLVLHDGLGLHGVALTLTIFREQSGNNQDRSVVGRLVARESALSAA